jgi:uncharacterized protein YjbJ (UPF0337 family)
MSATKRFMNTVDRLAGQAKERLGHATADPRLRDEGRADQLRARLRNSGERIKQALRGR